MMSAVPIQVRLAILEYLTRVEVEVSAGAVALAIGRSRSVAQRHLSSLCKEGVVIFSTGFNPHHASNTKMYTLKEEDG